ncbi:hypothetical protein [Chamaesiphon polymorphus]|uniref:Uncharacterized protein n=1 Tax=Chamaesiphon polymorphus CCALA 037 TaxID=2107692 RepID=A0A2T1GMN0_9CYAN|nr:hypothetical protein [Chamaesiphon polymorphus]PSB59164.1 hypothetical protein C7B77_01880 [Chamaesiphon polymorphus CCALA 037]
MTPNPTQKLTQLEDLIPETNVVATIEQDVATIIKLNNLEFRSSYDDLDFLVFALLPLHSNIRVALVSHQNAPVPGIEICVRHDLQDVGEAIALTLDRLNLTPEDLTWIDPQYEQDFFNATSTPLDIALNPSTAEIESFRISLLKNLKLLSDLGVDAYNTIENYDILILPENIDKYSEQSELNDSDGSIILGKLLKEEGARCANSYNLGLNANVFERRSSELWLGSVWVLNHTVLPLLISVVGRMLGETVQKRLEANRQIEDFQYLQNTDVTIIHAKLNFIDSKISTEIKFDGDADTFLKIIKSINDDRLSSKR